MYRIVFKPFLDVTLALISLLIISPVLIIIGVLLALFQNGNVLFVQPRPGKNNKVFKLMKFKTMNDERDENGNLLSDEQRLTWLGKFIRKTSLDEIPQLINILKGDMSFVGPRPLLVDYLPLYNTRQKRRHEVKPGITGWAQVNGRNAICWEQKFELDVWYVEHQSFWLDLKILFLTVIKVLKAEGISGENVATMQRFNGSE